MGSINARGGKLYLDFRYKNRRVREYLKLQDTPANRKRLKAVMERIESSITLGVFRLEDFFPHSKNVTKFKEHDERIEQLQASTPTFREFSETWFSENEIGWKGIGKLKVRYEIFTIHST